MTLRLVRARVNGVERIQGLEHVLLRDSFVLDLVEEPSRAAPDRIAFYLDVALAPAHSAYRPARPFERHRYTLGLLAFSAVTRVRWNKRRFFAFTDNRGRKDYGHIDTLRRDVARGVYRINGDWGEAEIASAPPSLALAAKGGAR